MTKDEINKHLEQISDSIDRLTDVKEQLETVLYQPLINDLVLALQTLHGSYYLFTIIQEDLND